MAEQNAKQETQQAEGFFAAAGQFLKSVQTSVNDTVSIVSEPLMRDGMLAAAGRQGAEEFWQALRPFNDTIQAHEPGTLLSPTQGEIGEARRPELSAGLGEILKMNTPYVPEPDRSQDQGMER